VEEIMNTKIPYLLALLALCFAVDGCKLHSETVRFSPELKPRQSDIGQGKPIGLSIADTRPDKQVGIVGDPKIESITVTAEEGSPSLVYQQTADALTKMGFKVEPTSDSTERSLRIEIRELQYASLKRPVKYDAKAKVLVGAIARGTGGRYERTYETEETGEYGSPPGQKAISDSINGLLSAAIDDVLADKQLLDVLAK
jgi:uncharacterized lipoprotein YajG